MAEEPRIYCTNRTVCDILDDMRKAYEVRNFSYLLGLIEELQHYANRMEAGLQDKKDLVDLAKERSELKKKVFELREEAAKQRLLKDKEYVAVDWESMRPACDGCDDKIVMTNEEWIAENLDAFAENLWDDDMMKDNPQ